MGEMDEYGELVLRALGAELRSWRQRRGMSREELAADAGISASTIGRIEREGPVDVGHSLAIARVLDVPLSTLVERAEADAAAAMAARERDDLAGRRARRASEGAPRVSKQAVAKRRKDRGENEDEQ